MIELDIHKRLQAATGPMDLDLSVSIEAGSFVVLYGQSGSGKTSILRMIAGLMPPEHGKIAISKNEVWFDSKRNINLKPQQRGAGIVFQDYALFPNMSIEANLKFAASDKDTRLIDHLIELTGLENLRQRKPTQLSGGQQQRVALARAIVQKPEILLLDEPLSALDRHMRVQLQELILKLHREFGQTTIMVSHDAGEILRLADRVLSIEHGHLVADGEPVEIFTSHAVGGKFQLTGEIMRIESADVIHIAEVLCGQHLIKVVVADPAKSGLRVGDQVVIASKAFNPLIAKIDK